MGKDPPCYRGRRPEEEGGRERTSEELARTIATTICGDIVNLLMVAVNSGIERIEEEREAEEERRRERDEQRRRDIQAHRNVSYRQLCPRTKKRKRHLGLHGGKVKETSKRTRTLLNRLSSLQGFKKTSNTRNTYFKNLAVTHARIFRRNGEIKCRMCGARFSFTRALYHHVTRVHCRSTRKLEFSEEERATALAALYPPEHTVKRLDPKKKYVCAVCKSVCDLLGLFVHMKQVHFGLLCQYCLKLFKNIKCMKQHMKLHNKTARINCSICEKSFSTKAYLTSHMRTHGIVKHKFSCSQCSFVTHYETSIAYHKMAHAGEKPFSCPECLMRFISMSNFKKHMKKH